MGCDLRKLQYDPENLGGTSEWPAFLRHVRGTRIQGVSHLPVEPWAHKTNFIPVEALYKLSC
jgi:hypothetical protein